MTDQQHHTLPLTPTEARHLLAVLRSYRETGDFHGSGRLHGGHGMRH